MDDGHLRGEAFRPPREPLGSVTVGSPRRVLACRRRPNRMRSPRSPGRSQHGARGRSGGQPTPHAGDVVQPSTRTRRRASVVDQEDHTVIADLAADHVAHGGAESDARALERVSTKQIVHRIGLVLSSCEQTHDDVLRSALHAEPPQRLVRVPWPGASGSLVGHASRRVPHHFRRSCR